MKSSIKTLIVGLILISTYLIQIQSHYSETKNHKKTELEKFSEYQINEFNNLKYNLLNNNVSLYISPITIELESKDEIIILAQEDIPVNKK